MIGDRTATSFAPSAALPTTSNATSRLRTATSWQPNGAPRALTEARASTPTGEIEVIGEFRHKAMTDQMIKTTFEGGYGNAGPVTPDMAMFAFGAEMVEVRVHRRTHEIRVPRTDIAEDLIPVNADVREVRVEMLEEQEDYVTPLGVKGIGELGIVGTAAATSDAVRLA